MRADDLISTIKSAAPELLPAAEAIFGRRPFRTLAKAGEPYALKRDVEGLKAAIEELIDIVRRLRPGTQDAAADVAQQASELKDQLDRDSQDSGPTTENIDKMAVPGRTRIESYVHGVMRQLRGTPLVRPDPFRLAQVAQRRRASPIDPQPLEKAVRRVMEQRREDIAKKSRVAPVDRGTSRERAEISQVLEKNLLNQLAEQRGRRLDLFGRKVGS